MVHGGIDEPGLLGIGRVVPVLLTNSPHNRLRLCEVFAVIQDEQWNLTELQPTSLILLELWPVLHTESVVFKLNLCVAQEHAHLFATCIDPKVIKLHFFLLII